MTTPPGVGCMLESSSGRQAVEANARPAMTTGMTKRGKRRVFTILYNESAGAGGATALMLESAPERLQRKL